MYVWQAPPSFIVADLYESRRGRNEMGGSGYPNPYLRKGAQQARCTPSEVHVEGVYEWGGGRGRGRVDGMGESPRAETMEMREVSTAGDGDGIRKADGGLKLPVVLR